MIGIEVLNTYFLPNSRGYNILRNYYNKYKDLFIKTIHPEFDDFFNQVFTNASSIKFTNEIKNFEAYIIGTIKIQCRVQLDKAIKTKSRTQNQQSLPSDEDETDLITNIPSEHPNAQKIMEQQEIFVAVNLFKLTLSEAEKELINYLIDEIPRLEIAERRSMNLNTLDTQIRRLRIKFLKYLEDCGLTIEMFSKLKKS